MISIKHLSKTYVNPDGSRLEVLKDVSCEIHKGEVISIIGPSGNGKSTLLRTINLMTKPTSGEIYFEGENILAQDYPINKLRQRMGMVFQTFNLFEHLTVLENVTLAPMKLKGVEQAEAEKEAMTLLRKVGMDEKCNAMPADLAGGQKQRVAIARALAMHPEVILFDEPLSALDPSMVGEVLTVIRQLAHEGMTMLFVTHKLKFARDVSTRIFFMYDGFIHEDGTPEQIFENPLHSATKAFVQRIRKDVFVVDGNDFDFLDMESRIRQFCIKYNIAAQCDTAVNLCQQMLTGVMASHIPLTVRITHSELSGETALDFMVEGLASSPLKTEDPALQEIRGLCREIVEEPTTRGFRVKLIMD